MKYTVEELQAKKVLLDSKKTQRAELQGQMKSLGEDIKKKFGVGSLKELEAKEAELKAALVSAESNYEKKCEEYREKYDV